MVGKGKGMKGVGKHGGKRHARKNNRAVIDGITTDMTTTHALQDNEVPTVGAVKTYVDAKMEADPTANTIRAMVSGVFDLKSVGVTGLFLGYYLPWDGYENAIVFTFEAGSVSSWQKYKGNRGYCFGIDKFGESAPYKKIFEYFNLTEDKILNIIQKHLRK